MYILLTAGRAFKEFFGWLDWLSEKTHTGVYPSAHNNINWRRGDQCASDAMRAYRPKNTIIWLRGIKRGRPWSGISHFSLFLGPACQRTVLSALCVCVWVDSRQVVGSRDGVISRTSSKTERQLRHTHDAMWCNDAQTDRQTRVQIVIMYFILRGADDCGSSLFVFSSGVRLMCLYYYLYNN